MATPREPSAYKPEAPFGAETLALTVPPCESPTQAHTPSASVPSEYAGISIPGYEVLSELGRGGMGVVYKARHVGLNRLVALKMILAGVHAGADELARFRGEALAVARLKHPNIVQIHDVGEVEGLPYFSLEFVEGGGLDRKLAGTPLPPKQAAALVETLARAMAVAHAAGLVHRDLKPANVLLAADGTPKVTDFGLVKRLDAVGQTASGAVMGTPSYMAPEQADGQSKAIGPACDIYALGAILYECLTGRPPFRAATAFDTIRQVVSEEPVPPRLINAQVPADVETVCLKCLQKEGGRRYESATLADDLRWFAEGRPIVARPVSRNGSARRSGCGATREALAGTATAATLALLAATLALVLGAAVSAYFGISASQEAAKAKKNEAEAIAKGKELETANERLKRTADDLSDTRDDLEGTLARSLLRPLAVRVGIGDIEFPMTDIEWDALWDLAANRDRHVGYRFVEEASRTPRTSRQLRDRAALALPAAVELDESRRAEVEKLMLARLTDPALRAEQKRDLALALAAWDGLSGLGASVTARYLIAAITDPKGPGELQPLAHCLAKVAARLEPKEAAQAAASLAHVMTDANHSFALVTQSFFAQCLSSLLARLEPTKAAHAAAPVVAALTQAMMDPDNKGSLSFIAESLAALVPYMGPTEAAQVVGQAAAALTQALKDTKNTTDLFSLARGLSAVAPYLGPREASQAVVALAQAIRDTRDTITVQSLVEGLIAMAARLEPKEASQVAATLGWAMKDTKDPEALRSVCAGSLVSGGPPRAQGGRPGYGPGRHYSVAGH